MLRIGLIITVALFLQAGAVQAAPEHEVKAAYLYNFLKFVFWDDSAHKDGNKLNVCLIGNHPFRDSLSPIEGRKIQNKTLSVKKIVQASELQQCQILFISRSEEKRLRKLLKDADSLQLLTISDIVEFTQRGGAIGFLQIGNLTKFDINMKNAGNNRIFFKSDLLELAEDVYR